jgi:uncharacterized Ntn-hydrolase superfamily protein
MTWSIIAKDSFIGRIGITVTSKSFAVGILAPRATIDEQALASEQ